MRSSLGNHPRVRAFRYAFRGMAWLVRQEVHARIHLAVSGAVILMGLWLDLPWRDWVPLFLAMGLVWTAEALNSALEAALDVLHPQQHPGIAMAKDMAAGAVMFAVLASVLVGLWVLGPPLWARLAP